MTPEQIEAAINAVARAKATEGVQAVLEAVDKIPGVGGVLAAAVKGGLDHVGVDALVAELTKYGVTLGRDLLKRLMGDDYPAVIKAGTVRWRDERP